MRVARRRLSSLSLPRSRAIPRRALLLKAQCLKLPYANTEFERLLGQFNASQIHPRRCRVR
jgi:hypothetical protein